MEHLRVKEFLQINELRPHFVGQPGGDSVFSERTASIMSGMMTAVPFLPLAFRVRRQYAPARSRRSNAFSGKGIWVM
jgi:hypothetical protein